MRRHLRPSCPVLLFTIGFVLNVAVSAGAQSLTRGQITDEWDNPLEGVTVLAERPGSALQQTTTTDENGQFQFVGLSFDDWSLQFTDADSSRWSPDFLRLAAVDWSITATLEGYEGIRQVVGIRLSGADRPVNFKLPVVATGDRFGEGTEFEAEVGTPRFRFEEDGTFEFEDAGGKGEGTYGIVALAAILIVRDYEGPDDTFNITTPVMVEFGDQLMTSLTHYGVQLRRLGQSFQRLQTQQPLDEVPLDELRALAEQGDAEGQLNLGYRYSVGQGVSQDYAEAVRWYRLAAGQGNATAQYNLGVRYDNGEGVPLDYAEAVRWYRFAAEQGVVFAQIGLGSMYASGEGVPQNDVDAHMWFDLAVAQSSGEDRDSYVEARDAVAESMTADQIAEARRRARVWTPTPEP